MNENRMFPTSGLNIVHVVRQFHPGIGGMENFVEQLSLQQLAAGHRVRVVTLDRVFDDPSGVILAPHEIRCGIDIRRVRFFGSRRYPLGFGVIPVLKDADLVHVHGIDFFCDYLAATAWAHRKPMVLTTHGGYFHTGFAKALKQIYFRTVTPFALSRYGAVIACSEEDKRTFGRICGRRLTLIPNPVDIEKFRGLASPDGATLIYFGRFAPNKELARLVSWFAGLSRRDRHWQLIIAGKPMGIGMEDLVRLGRQLGVDDRLEVHDTPTDEQLKKLISRSSIYVCASSYEGFGLAAIEASSAGLFPVLSDIAPFRQSLDQLGYGLVVDFDNPEQWAESYASLDRAFLDFRQGFRRGRVDEAVEPFAWQTAAPNFDAMYNQILGRTRRTIGRVAVDVIDAKTALRKILDAAKAGKPLMIAFCNAHTANIASKSEAMRHALGKATVLNDGLGIDLASRAIYGSPFPENLNGTDFVPLLMASATAPLRVFLLGAEMGVAEAAAANIAQRWPDIAIAGTMHGFFRQDQSEEVLRKIEMSGANLVLVALGQPRQEIWAAEYFSRIAGPVVCVGALLDFLAGRVPRAPALIRRLRMEWAFRLLVEPKRLWRRYLLGNIAFLGRVFGQRLSGRRV